jgi:hypothetical protein
LGCIGVSSYPTGAFCCAIKLAAATAIVKTDNAMCR